MKRIVLDKVPVLLEILHSRSSQQLRVANLSRNVSKLIFVVHPVVHHLLHQAQSSAVHLAAVHLVSVVPLPAAVVPQVVALHQVAVHLQAKQVQAAAVVQFPPHQFMTVCVKLKQPPQQPQLQQPQQQLVMAVTALPLFLWILMVLQQLELTL